MKTHVEVCVADLEAVFAVTEHLIMNAIRWDAKKSFASILAVISDIRLDIAHQNAIDPKQKELPIAIKSTKGRQKRNDRTVRAPVLVGKRKGSAVSASRGR